MAESVRRQWAHERLRPKRTIAKLLQSCFRPGSEARRLEDSRSMAELALLHQGGGRSLPGLAFLIRTWRCALPPLG